MNETETPQQQDTPDAGAARRAPAVTGPEPIADGGSRRPYRSPRLECHGRLARVTRFGGSEILDSGGGLGTQF